MKEETGIFRNIDKPLLFIYLALVLIGWLNIYAAVYNEQHSNIFDMSQAYGKQALWILTAFAIGMMVLLTDV